MNPSSQNDPEAIRSDIDDTRRRMDDTMDALGNRLQPRHLIDEVLGFFRREDGNGTPRFAQLRDKVTSSADTAVHAVVDTVKQNPIPALLIGAGVAWMIYESRRDKSASRDDYSYASAELEDMPYDPDSHYDRPLEYPTTLGAEGTTADSKLGQIKHNVGEKLSHAGDTLREKTGALRQRAGETFDAVKHRAEEMTARARESTREAYSRTRERVVTTAEQHPIEVGLVALAAGIIAGLALPTPSAVNRSVGPAADRLRERTRQAGAEILDKGKRVAQAAVSAAKEEAEHQGLTPDRLREKASSVADRAKEAGTDTARREGLTPGATNNPPGSQPNDPTMARPVA